MRILAIETSCDETALALVEAEGGAARPSFCVVKNLISSQIEIHRPFGGVVPNLAKREHLKNLPLLWQRMMKKELRIEGRRKSLIRNSQFLIPAIDLIAVTVGPGLEPALWTGINFAQELGKKLGRPVIGANHMEGHLYSFLLTQKTIRSRLGVRSSNKRATPNVKHPTSNVAFPAVALIVSGGHTILLAMKNLTSWKKLGETRDDAVGEAFDKVARLLKLPYPGGPEIEKIAKRGNSAAVNFPRPMMLDKSYDFSFSGLKTSVLYHLRGIKNKELRIMQDVRKTDGQFSLIPTSQFFIPNIAASFQKAAVDVLAHKTFKAADEHKAKSVILAGGVAANKLLRETLVKETKRRKLALHMPAAAYNTDNAAMIAAAGYFAHLRRKRYKLTAQGNLEI